MVHRLFTLLLVAALAAACAHRTNSTRAPTPRICTTSPESSECSAALESLALSQAPPGVARDEAVLEFSFPNRVALRLEDSPPGAPASSVALYRYHEYLAPQHAHIVHVHYYEGSSYVLISAASGRTRDLAGPPAISPDQARFMSYSLTGGYSVAELQVWRVADDLPELELRVRPVNWEPRGARWVSATRIAVPAHPSPDKTESWATSVQLELSEGVWSIHSEAR